MAVWIVGAEMILLSRTIAKRLPMLRVVASAKRRAPWLLKRKVTTGALVCGSLAWRASVSISPETSARRLTT